VFAAAERRDLDADILTLDPHSFEDVLAGLRRIGAAVGKETRAERILSRAHERVDAVQSSVDGLDRPRTAVLDWTDPLIKGGHWVRDVVRLAGGDESFQPDGPSEPTHWRNLREWDPERLIVSPCGFSVSRARNAAMELASHEQWERLSAVQSGHVYAVDGNALVNRPGPRLVESLEVLAGCLHPDDVSVTVDDWARRADLVSKRPL
jgi:iron complex transport system substrate-binding protein